MLDFIHNSICNECHIPKSSRFWKNVKKTEDNDELKKKPDFLGVQLKNNLEQNQNLCPFQVPFFPTMA